MSRISRIKLLIELTTVVAVDKQLQGAFERIGAARKTSRRSCQTRQVVTQFSVVPFHRVCICFAFRNFIGTKVIPQAIVYIKCITVVLLSLGCIIYQSLNGWLSTLPDHFTAQITARLSVHDGQDVDPVFLFPIKVNNSSISAVFTSLGTGTSAMLAALAWTHNETVR